MIFRYLIILALFSVSGLHCSAQLSFGGTPASFGHLKKADLIIPLIEMEPVDNNELLINEKSDPKNLKTFCFAKSFNVDISPDFTGVWEVRGEMKIWRLALRSKSAWSINLIFDKMIIPQGASLFIYTPDHSKILGAFTSNSEQSSGYFSTYPIAGDEMVVEYNEPVSATVAGELHIITVNHDYKNIFGSRPRGESGLCNMDVYCPEAANYLKEKQAVVCLIVAGRELCTGTLVNNTNQDKTPYILTAGHCIESATDAQMTVFCFNYESPACGNGASSLDGYVDQSLSGAFLKARSDSLDFALLELETTPPAEYRPYFAGWNRSSAIPTSTVSIHHPNGDVKKIARDYDPPKIGSYNNDFKSNSFWIIGKWDIGTTEAGSSGGALFNQNKLLIGSLTGGTSTCTDQTNDLFAMLNKQWDTNKATGYQLKYWLDPNSTGATELAGLNPYSSDSCKLYTNATTGEIFKLQRFSKPAGGYKSGHNQLKVTCYAERFTKTQQTLLSSVSIGAGRVYSSVSNQNSKIRLKVYDEDINTGLPDNELVSMDVPLSLMSEKKMNFIELTNPVVIKNHYFIGFEIDYSNPTDTFAVYHTSGRVNSNKNCGFAKIGGSWKPFYFIPELGISTSLMINANGCQNTAAIDNGSDGTGEAKFEVLYPGTGVTNYVLLRNNGNEEFCVITGYDLLGRKLFEEQRLLTITPKTVSMAQYATGVYFLSVETVHSRQVIKIVTNNPR